ncbi:hypothetical protein [Natronococcus occultus]|uniref:DUF8136 domain-containing protein n=1 Tax=Natronococcus occultus SP4 TaxID=694430 RepID=L0K5I3_9EURY|nr:hypothetical protein [Natronococcus occultus]AGB39780.1 hypothetical protein Natoc_4360 [Natronococcus occultus SP4]
MTDLSEEIKEKRDEAVAELDEIAEHARYKSLGDGRIRNPEHERIRLKYLRVMISAQDSKRKYIADRELEDMHERLERLEERDGIK